MTELLELRGVVEAAPDTVADILLDVRPGGRSPLAAEGSADPLDGDEFAVMQDGSRISFTVDRAGRSVTQQGEWWYRGVTQVEPDPRGSVVVHRIFNIAPGHRWAVGFVSRGPLNAAPASFSEQLHSIARQLGATAWVVDP
jgi:hypothetical protein